VSAGEFYVCFELRRHLTVHENTAFEPALLHQSAYILHTCCTHNFNNWHKWT